MKVLDHVMPREKTCGALDSFFGLVGPHQQLLSRVYKGYIPGAQHLSLQGLTDLLMVSTASWYFIPFSIRAMATSTGALRRNTNKPKMNVNAFYTCYKQFREVYTTSLYLVLHTYTP